VLFQFGEFFAHVIGSQNFISGGPGVPGPAAMLPDPSASLRAGSRGTRRSTS
jgi:hypothetical protein